MLEREIEHYLTDNTTILGKGLYFAGKQVTLPESRHRIDMVLLAKNGDFVLVEIKKGMAPANTLFQIISYATEFEANLNLDRVSRFIVYRHLEMLGKRYILGWDWFLVGYRMALLKELHNITKYSPPHLRMIIVAESFPDQLLVTCKYMRNHGVDIDCKILPYYLLEN